MRWSERPPALRLRSASLRPLRSGPRSFPVAVAHLILVRSMRHSYILVALLLTACAHLRIESPYAANLSEVDIAQLKALPLPDYYRPILVTTIARDHVKIWSGRTTEKIPTYRELHAYRRGGT